MRSEHARAAAALPAVVMSALIAAGALVPVAAAEDPGAGGERGAAPGAPGAGRPAPFVPSETVPPGVAVPFPVDI